ncbi:hypothetical protein GQ53DRAFT_745858 [Thozetella sp. PMI_491]|nr:hypothetical protein GQ53DRAFT_745858 [Thozetella sp. PMI_491]
MTQLGKCDVCRSRKVKCDEKRPVCSPCKKGAKPCRYRVAAGLRFENTFVTEPSQDKDRLDPSSHSGHPADVGTDWLLMRSCRRVGSQGAAVHIFVPSGTSRKMGGSSERLPPPRQLSDTNTRLLTKWISLSDAITSDLDTTFVFGNWLEFAAQRLSNSQPLTAAVDSFLSSAAAFANPTDDNTTASHKSYARAARDIRLAITAEDSLPYGNDICMAISLMRYVELVTQANAGAWALHQAGLITLLLRITKHGTLFDDNAQRIFFHCAAWDNEPAIRAGRNSVFDSRAWLAQRSLGVRSTNAAVRGLKTVPIVDIQRFCTILAVRLPRLVRLVRAARENPTDASVRAAATDLARRLYVSDLDAWIQENFDRGIIEEVPSRRSGSPLRRTYRFHSYLVYTTSVTYFELRVIVCGLVLALAAIKPSWPDPLRASVDVDAVVAEDIRAAGWIAMVVEDAERYAAAMPVPVDQVRLHQPLTSSFGAWDRMEHRCFIDKTPLGQVEGARARQMKTWLCDVLNGYAKRWRLPLVQEVTLAFKHEIVTGGPLPMKSN